MAGSNGSKPWRCEHCGGILGIVKRNGDHQPVLYVLWEAVPAESMLPEVTKREEVICEIVGQALIRCPVCGKSRRWKEGD